MLTCTIWRALPRPHAELRGPRQGQSGSQERKADDPLLVALHSVAVRRAHAGLDARAWKTLVVVIPVSLHLRKMARTPRAQSEACILMPEMPRLVRMHRTFSLDSMDHFGPPQSQPSTRCYQVVPPPGSRVGQHLQVAVDKLMLTIKIPEGWLEGTPLLVRPPVPQPHPGQPPPATPMTSSVLSGGPLPMISTLSTLPTPPAPCPSGASSVAASSSSTGTAGSMAPHNGVSPPLPMSFTYMDASSAPAAPAASLYAPALAGYDADSAFVPDNLAPSEAAKGRPPTGRAAMQPAERIASAIRAATGGAPLPLPPPAGVDVDVDVANGVGPTSLERTGSFSATFGPANGTGLSPQRSKVAEPKPPRPPKPSLLSRESYSAPYRERSDSSSVTGVPEQPLSQTASPGRKRPAPAKRERTHLKVPRSGVPLRDASDRPLSVADEPMEVGTVAVDGEAQAAAEVAAAEARRKERERKRKRNEAAARKEKRVAQVVVDKPAASITATLTVKATTRRHTANAAREAAAADSTATAASSAGAANPDSTADADSAADADGATDADSAAKTAGIADSLAVVAEAPQSGSGSPASLSLVNDDNGGVRVRLQLAIVTASAGARLVDCGQCRACLDKIKFGGPGKIRKACENKVRIEGNVLPPGSAAVIQRVRSKSQPGARLQAEVAALHATSGMGSRLRSRRLPLGGRMPAHILRQNRALLDSVSTRGIEVGDSYQAHVPPLTSAAIRPPPAPPPLCACPVPIACLWARGRWWCANASGGVAHADDADDAMPNGCSYELVPPPRGVARVPLCACGLAASSRYRRWWCPLEPRGCAFSSSHQPEHDEPMVTVDLRDESKAAAVSCAALLTWSAYGPMNSFAFVAPASGATQPHGLGVHARVRILPNQAICPLPEWLGMPPVPPPPSAESLAAIPTTIGAYINHAREPNARLEIWHYSHCLVPSDGDQAHQPIVLVVAREPIEPGTEIRIDYGVEHRATAPAASSSAAAAAGAAPPSSPQPAASSAATLPPPAELSGAEADSPWRAARTRCPPATEASAIFSLFSNEGLVTLGICEPDAEDEWRVDAGALTAAPPELPTAPAPPSQVTVRASPLADPVDVTRDPTAGAASGVPAHTADAADSSRRPRGRPTRDSRRNRSGERRDRSGERRRDRSGERRNPRSGAARKRPASVPAGASAGASAGAPVGAAAGASGADGGEKARKRPRADGDGARSGVVGFADDDDDDTTGHEEGSAEEDRPNRTAANAAAPKPLMPNPVWSAPLPPRRDPPQPPEAGEAAGADGGTAVAAMVAPAVNERFRIGDLVEVQEGLTITSGGRQWYTGYVVYVWFDDREPWTGYAVQFIQSEEEDPPRPPKAGVFEKRVAAKRVRPLGGASPPAADEALANQPEVLDAARRAAARQDGRIGTPGAAVYSNVGRVMRRASVKG